MLRADAVPGAIHAGELAGQKVAQHGVVAGDQRHILRNPNARPGQSVAEQRGKVVAEGEYGVGQGLSSQQPRRGGLGRLFFIQGVVHMDALQVHRDSGLLQRGGVAAEALLHNAVAPLAHKGHRPAAMLQQMPNRQVAAQEFVGLHRRRADALDAAVAEHKGNPGLLQRPIGGEAKRILVGGWHDDGAAHPGRDQ